jgi:hypothetical protein
MSVDIESGGSVAVTEPAGDGTNVHSGSQQAGRDVVPEVVQANTGDAGTLD